MAGWIARAGFLELPVTIPHAQRAGSWPQPHRDPFDRMLAAQSVLEDLPILAVHDGLEYSPITIRHTVYDDSFELLVDESSNPLRPEGVEPTLEVDREAGTVSFSYEVDGNPVIERWTIVAEELQPY